MFLDLEVFISNFVCRYYMLLHALIDDYQRFRVKNKVENEKRNKLGLKTSSENQLK